MNRKIIYMQEVSNFSIPKPVLVGRVAGGIAGGAGGALLAINKAKALHKERMYGINEIDNPTERENAFKDYEDKNFNLVENIGRGLVYKGVGGLAGRSVGGLIGRGFA